MGAPRQHIRPDDSALSGSTAYIMFWRSRTDD
jgi:hypothetical protein